jgi:hypothetical protein
MIPVLLALLVAWSWVCVTAGRIYEMRRQLRRLEQLDADEMNARDQWANQMEQGAA